MKSPAAYYFFLLYLTVIAKPLLPLAADWWAHEFNEAEHMARVHAVYGSNHLQKEEADASSESGKSQSLLKAEDIIGFHTVTVACTYDFSLTGNPVQHWIFEQHTLPSILHSILLPPPKLS